MVGRTCYERLNATTGPKQSEERPIHASLEEADDLEAQVQIAVGFANYLSCSLLVSFQDVSSCGGEQLRWRQEEKNASASL